MTNKTPEELMKRISVAVQTRDISVVRTFLEEFTMEILDAQKPHYEQLLIGAAEQGIISERERCLNLINDGLPDSEVKVKLMGVIRGEAPSNNA